MGLDISAYKGLVLANEGEGFDETGEDIEDGFACFYVNEDFPGREGTIKNRRAYKYDDCFGFRAGSYGGYNHWREELARIAGWPLRTYTRQYAGETESYAASAWVASEGPFWELINFSDCEGVIGAEASKKLAADFAEYQSKADKHTDEYWKERYAKWRKAFEMASENGCVSFH